MDSLDTNQYKDFRKVNALLVTYYVQDFSLEEEVPQLGPWLQHDNLIMPYL